MGNNSGPRGVPAANNLPMGSEWGGAQPSAPKNVPTGNFSGHPSRSSRAEAKKKLPVGSNFGVEQPSAPKNVPIGNFLARGPRGEGQLTRTPMRCSQGTGLTAL